MNLKTSTTTTTSHKCAANANSEFTSNPHDLPLLQNSTNEKSTLNLKIESTLKPSFFQSGSGIPVFVPTYEQFKNFPQFLSQIQSYGEECGLVKVIPPLEWTQQLPDPSSMLDTISIRHPIEQKFDGAKGIWRQWNIETRKTYSVREFKELSQSLKHSIPAALRQGMSCTGCPACTGQNGAFRKEKFDSVWHNWQKSFSDLVTCKENTEEDTSQNPLDTAIPEVLFPHFSSDFYKVAERDYWRNLTFNSPLYGADFEGSLMNSNVQCWNFQKLPGLLQKMELSLPGINRPYLYFGMWKATFAWHVEDMDLFSINYIHFGSAKQWYVIPPINHERFERLMQNLYPEDYKQCPQFLRHKGFHISPRILEENSIPYDKVIQEAGEIMLTFPYAYHAGYNLGFNCAESVNFAVESWIKVGRKAKRCQCIDDSVWIDVDLLMGGGLKSNLGNNHSKVMKQEVFLEIPVKRIRLILKQPKSDEENNPCLLCPNNDSRWELLSVKESDRKVHKICIHDALGIQVEGDSVTSITGVPEENWNKVCNICNIRFGASLKCKEEGCQNYYHCSCAWKEGFLKFGAIQCPQHMEGPLHC